MKLGALPKKAAVAAAQYLREHPEEFLRAAKNAAAFKLGVPLAALRFLAEELGGDKVPKDLFLEVRPPGIFARASLELMQTPLLASGTLIVDHVDTSGEALRVDLRIVDLRLTVKEASTPTPLAALLQSGALDVSRPGDLLAYMPKKPKLILEAQGDRLTLDLMQHPALAKEPLRKALGAALSLLTVDRIQTADAHVDVALRALPRGAAHAVQELKKLF